MHLQNQKLFAVTKIKKWISEMVFQRKLIGI